LSCKGAHALRTTTRLSVFFLGVGGHRKPQKIQNPKSATHQHLAPDADSRDSRQQTHQPAWGPRSDRSSAERRRLPPGPMTSAIGNRGFRRVRFLFLEFSSFQVETRWSIFYSLLPLGQSLLDLITTHTPHLTSPHNTHTHTTHTNPNCHQHTHTHTHTHTHKRERSAIARCKTITQR
jgi:hypothetical protein